jgi:hypothetical protein
VIQKTLIIFELLFTYMSDKLRGSLNEKLLVD